MEITILSPTWSTKICFVITFHCGKPRWVAGCECFSHILVWFFKRRLLTRSITSCTVWNLKCLWWKCHLRSWHVWPHTDRRFDECAASGEMWANIWTLLIEGKHAFLSSSLSCRKVPVFVDKLFFNPLLMLFGDDSKSLLSFHCSASALIYFLETQLFVILGPTV